MITELSKIEYDITKEVISISLSKAADSLSFFIQEKVLFQLLDLKINSKEFSHLSKNESAQKNYLLTTNIRGEIGGKAYLLLNELEAEKLVATNLPESVKKNPTDKAIMTDAILLEIDNIITASVVTQFSNILQCKIYGDVPQLTILNSNEVGSFLSDKNSDNLNIIYFNSRFITNHVDINPEFIWLLDDKFFNSVKQVISDEKKMELLHKLNSTG